MPHIVCTGRGRRQRAVLFASCVFVLGAVSLSAPAWAGCNSGNSGENDLLSSPSCQAHAFGQDATAVGQGADANGARSTALGEIANARGVNATAVGFQSGAFFATAGATTVGHLAGAGGAGIYSTALGAGIIDDVNVLTAAQAKGAWSVAIGGGDVAARRGAIADGIFAVAIGNRSVATGDGYAVALGYNAKANTGLAPTSVGTDSTAQGTNAAAFGRFSSATAENSTALGSLAQANKKSSVAIGFGSIANAPNTVSVGTNTERRRIVNVAQGIDRSDAVNLAQARQIAAAAARDAIEARESEVSSLADIRRELADLRALVNRQQQEIAELRGRKAAALAE